MDFKKTVLDSGLRIVTLPEEDSLTTTVLVLVEAGSKYENKEINGLSHFLEHMCFKGTVKRPRSIDIAGELDGIGAACNAFTAQEYTGYFAKSQPKHFAAILDVVSDMYLNPIFETAEIDKERGVIVEEINMHEDIPMRRVQEFFMTLLYGDQPAGWDISGRKEVIESLTRDDFIKYRREHYLAGSSIVVVSGKFDEAEAIEKVKRAFSGIMSGAKTPKIKTTENQEKPEIFLKHKETGQTHLVLGVRTFSVFDKRKYALQVLSDVLGGGMSSRLFQKIREEMGAAYYVNASADLYSDHGLLSVSSGVHHPKLNDVIEATLEEFGRLKEETVPAAELQRSKDHLVGNLFLGLEASDQIAGFYGGQEIITKEMVTPEEWARRIQAVGSEEVRETAQDIFKNEKLNLAVISPAKEKETLQALLKID
ncbi:MAG: insulinase family protein [Candidatus Colwellbacteria bacterium]|nr:insulinase family protein [Candidatus Colwellbacteria bacterium]